MSDTVRIIEMGARDGLQNEKTPVSVADRIAFIERLVAAGLNTIEVGAFVYAGRRRNDVGIKRWSLGRQYLGRDTRRDPADHVNGHGGARLACARPR